MVPENMIIFLLVVKIIHSQINITSYTNYPQYLNSSVPFFGTNIANNGNQILLSIQDGGIYKIIKLDVRDPSNVYKMGEYVWTGQFAVNQINSFSRTLFYQDYLIGCSTSNQKCKVWNLTSFLPVGIFSQNLLITFSQLIEQKGIYIFGSNTGNLLYVNLSTFPNPIINYIHNEATSIVRLQKSPDLAYLAVAYQNLTYLRIFNLSDWSIVNTLDTIDDRARILWSFQSRYLLVFPWMLSYFVVYDRNSNWQQVQNITIGLDNVRICHPHIETNTYLCLGGNPTRLFSINLFDYSVEQIFYVSGFNFIISENKKIFSINSSPNSNLPSIYYQFNKYCTGNTFYNIPSKSCVECDSNCTQCLSTTACKQCRINFTLSDGTCQPCGLNDLYNVTTKLCDDIRAFCPQDKYFSVYSLTCVSCQEYCQRCASTNSCVICIQGYSLTNGVCLPSNVVILLLQSSVLRNIKKIPGSRIIISQIFSFFINIDRLWLYIYHKRQYSQFMSQFFTAVQQLETEKWNAFVDISFDENAKMALDDLIAGFDFKTNQASQKFLEIEGQSSSFFASNFYFFCFNVPLVLLAFLLLRLFFRLLFNHKISLHLRRYSFKLFLVCLLMEGNIESFSYYFLFDIQHLKSENYLQKGANFLILLFFALFFGFVVFWFWIIKIVQKRKAKYFMDNFHINVRGLFHTTFSCGLFNFLLGACHILMEDTYDYMMNTLTCLEVGYIMIQIWSIRQRKVYRLKYIGWQNIIASFSRILLIFTFSQDKQIDQNVKDLFNQIQKLVVCFYIANWILSILIGYFIVIFQLSKDNFMYVINKILSEKNNRDEIECSTKKFETNCYGSEKHSVLSKSTEIHNKSDDQGKDQITECEEHLKNEQGENNKFKNNQVKETKMSQFAKQAINKHGDNPQKLLKIRFIKQMRINTRKAEYLKCENQTNQLASIDQNTLNNSQYVKKGTMEKKRQYKYSTKTQLQVVHKGQTFNDKSQFSTSNLFGKKYL